MVKGVTQAFLESQAHAHLCQFIDPSTLDQVSHELVNDGGDGLRVVFQLEKHLPMLGRRTQLCGADQGAPPLAGRRNGLRVQTLCRKPTIQKSPMPNFSKIVCADVERWETPGPRPPEVIPDVSPALRKFLRHEVIGLVVDGD